MDPLPTRLLFTSSLQVEYGDIPGGFVFVSSAKDCALGMLNPESFPQLGAHFGQLETRRPQVSEIHFFVCRPIDLRAVVDNAQGFQDAGEETYRRRCSWLHVKK